MNKQLADQVLAAARQVVGANCDVLVAHAHAGIDEQWVVLVSAPRRTGHNGWLSTWSHDSLDGLLAEVQAFHDKQVELHAAEPTQPSNWMTELTDRIGRG